MKAYYCLAILCLCVVLPVTGAYISNALQFINLINQRTPGEWTYGEVVNDLDFSNITLGKPLGLQTDGTCNPFKGTIKGNNYIIKGLRMNALNGNAGLFCGLDEATIDNLFFDESCSFIGAITGSLSVMASGDVALFNVANHGQVSGSSFSGGLIGYIMNTSDATIAFIDSVNSGTVTGKENCTGGFVGSVQFIHNSLIMFDNEKNTGIIDGHTGVGGLIGCVIKTSETSIFIDESTNHNKVIGGGAIGGFIGLIQNNTKMELFIEKTINNSTINASATKYKCQDGCGGIVGVIDSNEINVLLHQCTNNQTISGLNQAGGLIGAIQTYNQKTIIETSDCMNKGVINSLGQSCGFISSLQNDTNNIVIDIYNSKNEGNITGEYAYGIASSIRNGLNVVGMGFATGFFASSSLWRSFLYMESCFVLDQNVQNATTFTHCNLKCNFCIDNEAQECVQDLLNLVSNSFASEHFLNWDEDLNLIEYESVPSSGSFIKSSLVLLFSMFVFSLFSLFSN